MHWIPGLIKRRLVWTVFEIKHCLGQCVAVQFSAKLKWRTVSRVLEHYGRWRVGVMVCADAADKDTSLSLSLQNIMLELNRTSHWETGLASLFGCLSNLMVLVLVQKFKVYSGTHPLANDWLNNFCEQMIVGGSNIFKWFAIQNWPSGNNMWVRMDIK